MPKWYYKIRFLNLDIAHLPPLVINQMTLFILQFLELREYFFKRFLHNQCQSVQPSSMRHPEDQMVQFLLSGHGDQSLQSRYWGVATFDSETLWSWELIFQEFVKSVIFTKVREYFQLTFFSSLVEGVLFNLVQNPVLLFLIIDVGEFVSDIPRINFFQFIINILQFHGLLLSTEALVIK
jgi:hypothetical protein